MDFLVPLSCDRVRQIFFFATVGFKHLQVVGQGPLTNVVSVSGLHPDPFLDNVEAQVIYVVTEQAAFVRLEQYTMLLESLQHMFKNYNMFLLGF